MIITTIDEAKQAIEAASILEGRLEAAHAEHEARITPIKQEFERATKADADALESLRAALAAYIEAHRDQFQRPRKCKTPWGEFGLQASKTLQVTNPYQVKLFADRNGFSDVYETKIDVSKRTVQAIIKNGTSVPGAELVCRENPVVKIIPTLPDPTE